MADLEWPSIILENRNFIKVRCQTKLHLSISIILRIKMISLIVKFLNNVVNYYIDKCQKNILNQI